jgi:molybdopterin synthase catalytic subunit
MMLRTFLTDEAIDRQELIDEVMRRADGALALFEGVVRNHHQGKAVESIEYVAYKPMAEKQIGQIVDELGKRFPDVRIAVRHRLGLLRVGESSIVIACAAPHRGAAFEVCRMAIDRIKETVPIWKKEKGPDGEEWVGWQGSTPSGDQALH